MQTMIFKAVRLTLKVKNLHKDCLTKQSKYFCKQQSRNLQTSVLYFNWKWVAFIILVRDYCLGNDSWTALYHIHNGCSTFGCSSVLNNLFYIFKVKLYMIEFGDYKNLYLEMKVLSELTFLCSWWRLSLWSLGADVSN